jgi:hypothetical protein
MNNHNTKDCGHLMRLKKECEEHKSPSKKPKWNTWKNKENDAPKQKIFSKEQVNAMIAKQVCEAMKATKKTAEDMHAVEENFPNITLSDDSEDDGHKDE